MVAAAEQLGAAWGDVVHTYASLLHITLTAAAAVLLTTQLLLSAEVTCDACKAASMNGQH